MCILKWPNGVSTKQNEPRGTGEKANEIKWNKNEEILKRHKQVTEEKQWPTIVDNEKFLKYKNNQKKVQKPWKMTMTETINNIKKETKKRIKPNDLSCNHGFLRMD